MHSEVAGVVNSLAMASTLTEWLVNSYLFLKVLVGFSLIVFVHEFGHFLAAKWMDVRVDRFAVGFFRRVFGYRRGEGFTFGTRPSYTPEEIAAKGYGETDYCLNILPFGGYVKMLGQDDIQINEDTGEMTTGDDPRAFPNKPISKRMVVVSAGVICNVVFAVLLYMFVFLVLGKSMVAPLIGQVEPGSAAAAAGLLAGDRVVEVDGRSVSSFEDVVMAAVLASDRLRLKVERAGQPLDREIDIEVGRKADGKKEAVGIWPMYTAEVVKTPLRPEGRDVPRPGDKIVAVNGTPVRDAFGIMTAFQNSAGHEVHLTVERPDPEHPGTTRTLEYAQRPVLQIEPDVIEGSDAEITDSRHLLGLRPRWIVGDVAAGEPADQAGFQRGDVVTQWGTTIDPLYAEILASIHANAGKPVQVVVARDGQRVPLTVTPQRSFQLFGSAPPRIGVVFGLEERRAVVADVVPGAPAAEVGMPRGAEIIAIGSRTVSSWSDVYEALRAAVGTTVEVRYRSGADEAAGHMAVPSSLVDELTLPPSALILSIDGQDSVTLPSGKKLGLALSASGVRRFLEQKAGKTVTIEYARSLLDLRPQRTEFQVRKDNVDPWQMRVHYTYDLVTLRPFTELVTAHGNPLTALAMGGKSTYRMLWNIYLLIKNMATQNVGVQNVAGPVGIFRVAIQQAELGWSDLLFFLAFISVNLAVINFMPLPVVDGGLMLFLILERIRGKPLSAKMQIITTLAGLALIVLSFLFVTIQDITRLFGGS